MTMITSRKGQTKDLDLDIDAIIAYEAQHPDFSLMDLFGRMEHVRFTDLDLMARLMGFDGYKAFVEDGYSMEDLSTIIQGSRFLGFTDSPDSGE